MSVPVKLGLVDKVRAHLELLDPVTWISVFPCLAGGVMASGAMQPTVHDYLLLLAIFHRVCIILRILHDSCLKQTQ